MAYTLNATLDQVSKKTWFAVHEDVKLIRISSVSLTTDRTDVPIKEQYYDTYIGNDLVALDKGDVDVVFETNMYPGTNPVKITLKIKPSRSFVEIEAVSNNIMVGVYSILLVVNPEIV